MLCAAFPLFGACSVGLWFVFFLVYAKSTRLFGLAVSHHDGGLCSGSGPLLSQRHPPAEERLAGEAEEQRTLCAVIRKDVADLREECSEMCEIGNFMVLHEEVQALSEQERSGAELELALRHLTFEVAEFQYEGTEEMQRVSEHCSHLPVFELAQRHLAEQVDDSRQDFSLLQEALVNVGEQWTRLEVKVHGLLEAQTQKDRQTEEVNGLLAKLLATESQTAMVLRDVSEQCKHLPDVELAQGVVSTEAKEHRDVMCAMQQELLNLREYSKEIKLHSLREAQLREERALEVTRLSTALAVFENNCELASTELSKQWKSLPVVRIEPQGEMATDVEERQTARVTQEFPQLRRHQLDGLANVYLADTVLPSVLRMCSDQSGSPLLAVGVLLVGQSSLSHPFRQVLLFQLRWYRGWGLSSLFLSLSLSLSLSFFSFYLFLLSPSLFSLSYFSSLLLLSFFSLLCSITARYF